MPAEHALRRGRPGDRNPLSGARALQDILLQSWGGTIRIFPGVPESWKDVTFHNLRAEGAFLVSAQRRDGKTQDLTLKKGESITLGPAPDTLLVPVDAQPGKSNTLGLP